MDKKVAQAVLDAAKIRENSWNGSRYILSLEDSCVMACEQNGCRPFARLIYLALEGWWNDALIWADDIIGDGNDPEVRASIEKHEDYLASMYGPGAIIAQLS